MTEKKRRSYCPMSSALDVLGDKWSLLVVRDILLRAKRTHKAFRASDEGIATNILGDRIARLEAEGIIAREKDPSDGRSEIFSLTQKGVDLLPVLLALTEWSGKYDPELANPAFQPQLKALADDMRALIGEIESGADLSAGRQLWPR